MKYQLTNRQNEDRNTFDIMPALQVLENFVKKRKMEEQLKQVNQLVSQKLMSVDNEDVLIQNKKELINSLINSNYEPEIVQKGLSLVDIYDRLSQEQIKYKKEKQLEEAAGGIAKESMTNKYYLYNGQAIKGEELFLDLKQRYPDLKDDELYGIITKVAEPLAVDKYVSSIDPEKNTATVTEVLKDRTGREISKLDVKELLFDKGKVFLKQQDKLVPYQDELALKVWDTFSALEREKERERKERIREFEPRETYQTVVFDRTIKVGDRSIQPNEPVNVKVKMYKNGASELYLDTKGKLVKITDEKGNPLGLSDVYYYSKSDKNDITLLSGDSNIVGRLSNIKFNDFRKQLAAEVSNLKLKDNSKLLDVFKTNMFDIAVMGKQDRVSFKQKLLDLNESELNKFADVYVRAINNAAFSEDKEEDKSIKQELTEYLRKQIEDVRKVKKKVTGSSNNVIIELRGDWF